MFLRVNYNIFVIRYESSGFLCIYDYVTVQQTQTGHLGQWYNFSLLITWPEPKITCSGQIY